MSANLLALRNWLLWLWPGLDQSVRPPLLQVHSLLLSGMIKMNAAEAASVGGLVFLCGGLSQPSLPSAWSSSGSPAAASFPFLPGVGSSISPSPAMRFRPF
jgi:hypothetical protein